MTAYRSIKRGFTLVEILIVVIILGILAAIVIPQFTNASQDARVSSVVSQLQTLRSQIELYRLEHGGGWPTDTGASDGTWSWAKLTGKTDADIAGTINATGVKGPYLQSAMTNPLSNSTTVADAAAAGVGFVFDAATGKISAVDSAGAIFNEAP